MWVKGQSKYPKAFQRAGSSKSDWLVMLQQVCSTITLVDAITTAWEH